MATPAFNPGQSYQAAPPAFDPNAAYEKDAAAPAADQGEGSFSDIFDRAWDRLKKAATGDVKLTDYDAATLSGIGTIARGTGHAIEGAYNLVKPPSWDELQQAVKDSDTNPANIGTAILARRMASGVKQTAEQAKEVPGAIRDINASPDPLGHYAHATQDTLSDLAGQAIVGAATEGAVKGAGAVRDVATGSTPTGAAVKAGAKAAAKQVVKSGIRRIPYVGEVAGDVADAARQAYTEAKNPPKPKGAAAAKRTVVVDPDTGEPEFSDVIAKKKAAATPQPAAAEAPAATTPVVPTGGTAAPPAAAGEVKPLGLSRQQIIDRLSAHMDRIEGQDAAAKANPEAPPARDVAADEDLTSLLEQSRDIALARRAAHETGAAPPAEPVDLIDRVPPRGGISTSADPEMLLKRWGVDEESLKNGREQTRGMSPEQTEQFVQKLTERYKKGEPVEPILETRDADNNITDVDGRARAIAAQRAGVKRIPIIVRRVTKPTVQ